MLTLNCVLEHDSGEKENVSCSFEGDWRDAFDYLVRVHCRVNTVELFPVRVTIGFTDCVISVYDREAMDMIEVDDE